MALKGTLKDFSLADIFQLIGIQHKTGVLTLKNDKEVVTVSFVEGNVVSADALHRRLEDRIGTVLVKSGRITEAQLQEALRIQKNTLKRMGNILVENRFIDPNILREALQIQISKASRRMFGSMNLFSTRMFPIRFRVFFWMRSASWSCASVIRPDFTSTVPIRSSSLRCRASAETTFPSTNDTVTTSLSFLRVSTPVLCWMPMSWKMSAKLKSFSVPFSAMPRHSFSASCDERFPISQT